MLHDADIREPLFDFLEEVYGKVRIIEEKNIGRSRADVIMITNYGICGIEIKSDADSYARLEGQVKDYDRYCDFNFAVVGTSHAEGIKKHVPAYWGIITVEEAEGIPDFYILRKPEENPMLVLSDKLHLLWRPELVKLQKLHEMPAYKDRSKDFVIGKIVERTEYPMEKKGFIDRERLKQEICEELFERDYTTIGKTIRTYKRAENKKKKKKTLYRLFFGR